MVRDLLASTLAWPVDYDDKGREVLTMVCDELRNGSVIESSIDDRDDSWFHVSHGQGYARACLGWAICPCLASPRRDNATVVNDRLALLGVTDAEADESRREIAGCLERARKLRGEIPEVSVDPLRRPDRIYVLAMTYRTGSTLLKDWLAGTGVLGKPEEYLNTRPGNLLDQWAAAFRAEDIESYVRRVAIHHATPNGVFGIKVEFMQYLPVIRSGVLDDVGPEPRFIYLTRKDLLAQAVSLARARATGRWNSSMTVRFDGDADETAVVECLWEVTRRRELWDRFFALKGIEPLRLTYEEMIARPGAAVADVATHLGIELPGPTPSPTSSLEIQRDARNASLMERIREQFEKASEA